MIRLRVKEVAESKRIGKLKLSRMAGVSYKTVKNVWDDPYRETRVLKVPIGDLLIQELDEDEETL